MNYTTKSVLVFLLGTAVGAVAMRLYDEKTMNEKINEIVDAEFKKLYNDMDAKMNGEDEPEENISHYHGPRQSDEYYSDDPVLVEPIISDVNTPTGYFGRKIMEAQHPTEDDEMDIYEIDIEDFGRPFIEDGKDFEKVTVTWYEKNNLLESDNDDIVLADPDTVKAMFGDSDMDHLLANYKFHLEGSPDVAYIRNRAMKTDFEIVRSIIPFGAEDDV